MSFKFGTKQYGHAECIFIMKNKTLADSESVYHKMLRDICMRHGKIYTKELEARITGATDREVSTALVRELGLDISPAELEREIENVTRFKLPKSPVQKGAERLLHHLHDTGVMFALATNSTRKAVRLHEASRPKLFGMFHHKVCSNDPGVHRGKPFPDIYLAAAAKFPDKPKPNKCLVFEDSACGLEAGVSAGMQVVLIPPRRLPPEHAKKATIILKSLLDFKPELFGLPPFKDKAEKADVKKKPKEH